MDKEMVALGNRLREARRSAAGDPTLAVVAKKLEVSESYLSQMENGKKQPGWRHLRELAILYGTTTDALVGLGDGSAGALAREEYVAGEIPEDVRHLLDIYDNLSSDGRDLFLRMGAMLLDTETRRSSTVYTEQIIRAMVSDEEWELIQSARALARAGDEVGARHIIDVWLSER